MRGSAWAMMEFRLVGSPSCVLSDVISGFPGEDVHPDDTVLARDALLELHVPEADPHEDLDELSLRESTGNSTSPEVDVSTDRFGEFVTHDDVCVEEPSARLEHAEDFGVRDRLVRGEVQDSVRDHDVDACVRERQRHGVSEPHLDVLEPC